MTNSADLICILIVDYIVKGLKLKA